jgi:hypothetical protein
MIETLGLTDVSYTKARLRIAKVTSFPEVLFLDLIYRTEEQANLSERTYRTLRNNVCV